MRDPDELRRAAPSFNNLPILSEHQPVTASAHRPELVVGSTGSAAVFEMPFLKNSMIIWARDAIDGIESGRQRELSAAYRYVPVVMAGSYQGQRYDIVMTELEANHLALVSQGRAGSEVVVGDSALRRRVPVKLDGAQYARLLTTEGKAAADRYFNSCRRSSMAFDEEAAEPATADKVIAMLREAFGTMEEAEVQRVCAWVAAGKFGEDEIDDADRPAGEMPNPAMDAAMRFVPDLARIKHVYDSYPHGVPDARRGSGRTSSERAEAVRFAPDFARIKVGGDGSGAVFKSASSRCRFR